MPFDDFNEDEEAHPNEPRIECSMCHQQVPFSQTVTMSGRRLCFGCAAAWFDDDEPEKES